MKRSNRGKAYFYAMGQRDKLQLPEDIYRYAVRHMNINKLPEWAINAYNNGYNYCSSY